MKLTNININKYFHMIPLWRSPIKLPVELPVEQPLVVEAIGAVPKDTKHKTANSFGIFWVRGHLLHNKDGRDIYKFSGTGNLRETCISMIFELLVRFLKYFWDLFYQIKY